MQKTAFLDCLKDNNAFYLDVLKAFIEDSKSDEDIQYLLNGNGKMMSRSARLLCYLKDKFGMDGDGSLLAKFRKEDMAGILGTSSEYVNQLLARLQEGKAIRLKWSRLWIISQEKLMKFC